MLTEKPIRILHLEDDRQDAELCLRKLKSSGLLFTLSWVCTQKEFELAVSTNEFDIVLGDFHLQLCTGLDALRWLRRSGHTMPFILITGALGDEMAIQCIREGAADYLLKGNLERLPIAIRRALDEQRERENTIRLERQYSSIIQGAPYGIYRMTGDGRITLANPALVAMLGYESEAELLRLNMGTSIFADRGLYEQILFTGRRPSTGSDIEAAWRRKDGQFITVRLVVRRLQDDLPGQGTLEVFAQDITGQRILEQQFRQAQKMESIGRLAGGVAHDFNNLLMIMRGCTELMERNLARPDKVKGYLAQINETTSIAATIVQQLMAFSRKQTPQRGSLDLNIVLHDIRKMLPRLLGEDIETIFHLGAKLERINADRAQIEQIILNMAVNARDAMPRGGSLIFKTTNVNLRKPQMQMDGAVLPVGTYVGFIVTDTGSGMSPEIQSQIFEPFFTTKEQGKGTGLGLATVYGIVKESSGFITVESAPGKGSTFKMYFPTIEVVHEASPPSALMLPPPAGAETILLVEDEAALREITCEYLQGLGYTMLPASSGLRALDICRMHDGPIHILLTDIIMPGIRGPDLVRAAMEIRPELHVIYMSGYSDRDMETGAVPEHMSFLAKPYSLESLAHTIRTVASGSGATVH